MVDTKDQSNAIVYWVWYFVCRHCRYKDQSMQGIECYICRHSQCKTRISNAFNPIYVDTVDTKHIHTLLPITFLIFNGFSIRKKFWKAETQSFSTIPSILYMSTLSYKTRISNAFNPIYVDTVDTKHIHTYLLITFLIFNGFSICKKFWKAETQSFSTIPSILYMSTLSIQDKDL